MSGRIVVGVDGSESSVAALRWALAEAQVRGATLDVVTAFSHLPPDARTGDSLDSPFSQDDSGGLLREAIESAGLSEAQRALVHQRPMEGKPADVLIAASDGADLVVVGSRGQGKLRGAILGSVSDHVVRHSKVPVAIVHAPKPA
jgi:nucleotide-binding universal stress UspA family protein